MRYLPRDVRLGDPRPDFLTVGTYPRENALDVEVYDPDPDRARQLVEAGIVPVG